MGRCAGWRPPYARVADRSADHWLKARLEEMAEDTAGALRALIPPPVVPPSSFWRRLWAWLCRIWAGLCRLACFWRWGRTQRASRSPGEPVWTLAMARAEWEDRLIATGRRQIELAQLEQTLQPGPLEDSAPASPFELTLSDLPAIRERFLARCAPSHEELAWTLTRAVAPELLTGPSSPAMWLDRAEQVEDRLLKLDQRTRLLWPEDCRALLDQVAESVCLLYCGCGDRPRRIALVPPSLSQVFQSDGYEAVTGSEGEIVYLIVQAGLTVQSLLSSEDQADERA